MFPVLRGCISYESLKNGAIDLADLVMINRALINEAELKRKAIEEAKASK